MHRRSPYCRHWFFCCCWCSFLIVLCLLELLQVMHVVMSLVGLALQVSQTRIYQIRDSMKSKHWLGRSPVSCLSLRSLRTVQVMQCILVGSHLQQRKLRHLSCWRHRRDFCEIFATTSTSIFHLPNLAHKTKIDGYLTIAWGDLSSENSWSGDPSLQVTLSIILCCVGVACLHTIVLCH